MIVKFDLKKIYLSTKFADIIGPNADPNRKIETIQEPSLDVIGKGESFPRSFGRIGDVHTKEELTPTIRSVPKIWF